MPRKIAIVGGGAAGLMAAITAAEAGGDVWLFERNSEVGRKILASGNGRCNISNTTLHAGNFFGQNRSFVSDALHAFNFHHFQKFCRSIGLFLQIQPDGRVYPLTNEAKSVKMLFEERCETLHVKICCDAPITRIDTVANTYTLHTQTQEFEGFEALIIATGSEAAPQLGGCDDGMRFAKAFGHEILPTYPSLVGLHLASPYPQALSGVKTTAELTLWIDREAHGTSGGDLLFTAYGISGFAALDLSQGAAYALMQGRSVGVSINLLPQFQTQELASQLGKLTASMRERTIYALLCGLISSKIAPHLLQSCRIDPATPCAGIGTKTLKHLLHTLREWRFEVTQTHGFKHAEVSGGGVSTEMIDPQTMASKRHKGLYFAGELLDVVGERGGYNLHFAWASGYLAAKAASRS
ncbi:MAG: NAD(P)/FAD-dependent oxidoreductase [Campylobacterales bacterium]|nr:NAD(P)/FAD-dependent oxidoreductase [Campylobacterales bacterium]